MRRSRSAVGSDIEVLRTPVKAPRANAICERLLGSVRRECLDHIVVVSEAQLWRVLGEYVSYFNQSRPHQGIEQRLPDSGDNPDIPAGTAAKVVSFPVLGGLHLSIGEQPARTEGNSNGSGW